MYRVLVPQNARIVRDIGPYPTEIDLVSNRGTAVNRRVARRGLAGYEPDTQATLLTLMRHKTRSMVFYDIGAHVGLYTALLSTIYRRQGVNCFAFEPTPKTAKKAIAIRNANGLGYSVVQTAMSSAIGEVEFYLSTKAETSNSLNADFRPGSPAIRVKTDTVDNFVEQGAPPPTLMKIDVETYEPAVIQGCGEVISKFRPFIVCEVLPPVDQAAVVSMIRFLAEQRYHFYNITPAPSFFESTPAEMVKQLSLSHRDWILAPKTLSARFPARLAEWRAAIRQCRPTEVPGPAAEPASVSS